MHDSNDPFSNMSSNTDNNIGHGTSERDRLDIDSQGKSKSERDKEKQQQYEQQNGSSGRGRFNRQRNNNGGRGVIATVLIIAVIVGTLIYLPMAYRSGSLSSPFRSLFASPEENLDSFFVSILQMDKTVNDLEKTPDERRETQYYDTNNIFMGQFLGTQVEPEYMVYIYTGNEDKDEPFTEWVSNYESGNVPEGMNTTYKIYRLNISQIEVGTEAFDYVENEPMMFIYNTPFRDSKMLDSVVRNPSQLDDIPAYMDRLVEEANENW